MVTRLELGGKKALPVAKKTEPKPTIGDRARRTPRAVMVRLTDDEFSRVQAAATKAAGGYAWRVSVSAFCRDAILKVLPKAVRS